MEKIAYSLFIIHNWANQNINYDSWTKTSLIYEKVL